MGNVTKTKVDSCELCCEIISKQTKPINSVNYLWNYRYHQNLKEALLPSASLSSTENNKEDSQIPKLTFSLNVGKAIKLNNDKGNIKICQECIVELEELDTLHQQLEYVQELINCQVNKINDKHSGNEATRSSGRSKRKKTSLLDNIHPPAGINFGRCSIGKENISQTLTFLNTICDRLSSSPPPTAPSRTSKPSKSKKIKIDIPDEPFRLVEETETNGVDETLSNEEIDQIEKALDIKVGEEFVSINKMEPDFGEEADVEVPEKDLLEIPDIPTKHKKKYEKRPENTGNGPRFRPCKLCNTKVYRWNWERHQKWHKEEKQWTCELCPVACTTKGSLQRHQNWHNKDLWIHNCEKCGIKFLHKYKLVIHQKICQGGGIL